MEAVMINELSEQHRKVIDDWGTPKPATERHSFLQHLSGHTMRKGHSKFGTDIGDQKTRIPPSDKFKENVIDKSFDMPISPYDPEQAKFFRPKSSVHMTSKSSLGTNDKLAVNSLTSDVFWATMKPQTVEKNIPFSSMSNSKQAIVPERSREEKVIYKSPIYGKRHNPVSNITDRHTLHSPYGTKTLGTNASLGLTGMELQQPNEKPEIRSALLGSSYNVLDSRRHAYDINAKYESNQGSATRLTVPDQYVISANEYSSVDSNPHSSLKHMSAVPCASSLTPVMSRESFNGDGSGKWDQVINAKDNLIQKKDNIIERQKQTIEQLQSHIIVIEERISQNSLKLNAQIKEDEQCREKLDSSEHLISHLKAQLQHVSTTKQAEIEKLQKKLGETEYELQKLEKGFKDVGKGQAKEILELKRKIEEHDHLDRKLKSSLDVVQNALKEERRKAQNLKQYLQDLPTAEEHTKTLQQIKGIKLEKSTLEERIEYLEQRLKETRNQIKQKDTKLEEETQSKEDFEQEIKRLTDLVNRYKEREKCGPVTMEEFDEVKWDNERIKADCERLKKLIEQKHKKMKTLHEQSQSTVTALEEHIAQEENTVNVLRKELETKDVAINDIKMGMKQIQDRNQALMEENMALRDLLQELERLTSTEVQDAHNQVQKELACCVSEISFLIDLCSEIAEGRDPNMSALLGIKGHGEIEFDEVTSNPFSVEAAKVNLSKIRNLRSEIDKLRTFVSDKYAEDVGNNCITQ